ARVWGCPPIISSSTIFAAFTKAVCKRTRSNAMEKATFAAGCFWGVEAAFRQIKGVSSTSVGYSGGSYKEPSYRDVCTGRTGHAEVAAGVYDPARVSYAD